MINDWPSQGPSGPPGWAWHKEGGWLKLAEGMEEPLEPGFRMAPRIGPRAPLDPGHTGWGNSKFTVACMDNNTTISK